MKRAVVIARYNESTDWVPEINWDYVIYNKGNKIEDNRISKNRIIEIPNEGREAETFLRYIVSNYDSLPDSIAFIQGNPFDHHPNTLSDINSNFSEEIIRMGPQTFCDLFGRDSYPGLPVGEIQKTIMPDLDLDIFNFTAGAQLIVDKKFILNKSLFWWESVLSLYNHYWFSNIESGYGHKPGSFIAHVFERLWEYIFKYKIYQ